MSRFPTLLCGLMVLGGPAIWAGSRSPANYPAYEPPRLEQLPEEPQTPVMNEAPPPPSVAQPESGAPSPAVTPEELPALAPPSAAPASTRQALPESSAETPSRAATMEPPAAPAAQKPPRRHYSVWIWQENGDCLWRIAEKVYGDRDKWKLIYLANKDVIKDPNRIYPRQRLKIPPADWKP